MDHPEDPQSPTFGDGDGDVIEGGDGYSSHAACNPDDAVADLSGPDGDRCWICGEDLD